MQSIKSSDELQAELQEASRPPSGQGEEEPTGTEKEEATGDSEGLPREISESEAVATEKHGETEKDAEDSLHEWQDIDLVITWRRAFTHC